MTSEGVPAVRIVPSRSRDTMVATWVPVQGRTEASVYVCTGGACRTSTLVLCTFASLLKIVF